MSKRHSRPPRSRKSRSPDPGPNDVQVIVPPSAAITVVDESVAKSLVSTETDELAAIEADWDELLVAHS
jgi:hypothetical protein